MSGRTWGLTRTKALPATVRIEDLAGQTKLLLFTLVSRGQTNAVLNVSDIGIPVNPDGGPSASHPREDRFPTSGRDQRSAVLLD